MLLLCKLLLNAKIKFRNSIIQIVSIAALCIESIDFSQQSAVLYGIAIVMKFLSLYGRMLLDPVEKTQLEQVEKQMKVSEAFDKLQDLINNSRTSFVRGEWSNWQKKLDTKNVIKTLE